MVINSKRKYYVDEDYFEEIDYDKKAYLLGYLYADGCVRHSSSNRTYGFKLKIHEKDIHIIDFIQSELKSNYPVVKEYGTNCFSVSINSKKISEDLINIGCVVNKTLILEYPVNIDKKYWNSFIHGYFDGDGCISYCDVKYKKQRMFKLLGTNNFLSIINKYFTELGINCYDIIKYTNSNIYQLRVSKKECLKKIYEIFYNNSKYLFLNRKEEIFKKSIK